MKRSLHLLIIDPQNDFCDLPAPYLQTTPAAGKKVAPALPVPGAHADMQRVAQLIQAGRQGLSGISVTLDSHHRLDVAHPAFWKKGDGSAVTPWTQITAGQVRAGEYEPRSPEARERVLTYLDTLEAAGRYTLMVWPVHCEIGTWGHNIHADIQSALGNWESETLRSVNYVIKGMNPWTEHYSAIEAEVPDAQDEDTQLNRKLIDLLARSDRVYITGEAGSHCVKATTEHIVANFAPQEIAKLVLVTDCMSPVAGFEKQYLDFVDAMRIRGMQVANSDTVLSELLANV